MTNLEVFTPAAAATVEHWYRHRTEIENLSRHQTWRRLTPPAVGLPRDQHRLDVGCAARRQHRRLATPAHRHYPRRRPPHPTRRPRRQSHDRHPPAPTDPPPRPPHPPRRSTDPAPTTVQPPTRRDPRPTPRPTHPILTTALHPSPTRNRNPRNRRAQPGRNLPAHRTNQSEDHPKPTKIRSEVYSRIRV